MKKVKTNKLKLNKETLTNLQMGSVAGGKTDPTKAKTCSGTTCQRETGCTTNPYFCPSMIHC